MDGIQIKGARAMLGMSQSQLCAEAGISRATLIDLENGTGDPRRSSTEGVEAAFRRHGIVFTEDGETVSVTARRRVTR